LGNPTNPSIHPFAIEVCRGLFWQHTGGMVRIVSQGKRSMCCFKHRNLNKEKKLPKFLNKELLTEKWEFFLVLFIHVPVVSRMNGIPPYTISL